MVAAASAGAAAVRKADPVHYPAAPHAYFRLAEHELSAPLLCAVCFERVETNNLFQASTTSLGDTQLLSQSQHKQAAMAFCVIAEWDMLCLAAGFMLRGLWHSCT